MLRLWLGRRSQHGTEVTLATLTEFLVNQDGGFHYFDPRPEI